MKMTPWFQRSGFFLLALTTVLWALAACSAPPTPVSPTMPPSDAAAPREEATDSGNIKTIFVGSERVECVGVAPQECYLVRESQDEEYRFFYDEIEGFTFEPGFEFELLVEEITVEDPPADASSMRWVLVEEVSRTAVSPTADTTTLENNIWVLNTLDGEPVGDVRVTIQFEDGSASGNGGCNSYSGSYTLDGQSLTFDEAIAMTMMACIGPAETVEPAYMALLSQVASYQIDNGALSLLPAEGDALLVFSPDQPASLMGVEWVAIAYNNGRQAVTSPMLETEITVMFGADGQISGNASCNNFNGGFSIDGQNISVGELATTRMMCPEEVMQQEFEFLAALQNATTFTQDGDLLSLFGEDGSRMMDLLPAEVVAAQAGDASVTSPGMVAAGDVANPDFLLTNWLLAAYKGQPVSNIQAGIKFTSDQFSGNGGCNTFFGAYSRDGQNLTIEENIGSTMMACPGPVMQFEQTLLNTLPQATSYQIENGLLNLLDANGNVLLVFYEDAPAALEGTPWTVIAIYNGRGGMQSVLAETEATILFDAAAEGSVSGNASCNQYNGPYTLDGDNISVGVLVTSKMLCDEEPMQQEANFLSALQSVATFSIESNRLTLFDGEGGTLIQAVGDTNPLSDTAVGSLPSIDLSNVSLDTAVLGQQVGGELMTRLEYNADDEAGAVGHPAHLLFTADGAPFMRIFPIAEYMAMWDAAGDPAVSNTVASLEALLVAKPLTLAGEAPILPPNFAYPDVIGQVRYFNFANDAGAGVRYLGRFVSEANPVTSDQLAYYYQGLTADGMYYLSVVLPLSTEAFPATLTDLTDAEIAAIFETYDEHLSEATAVVNNLAPSDITPNLSDLDGLVANMILTPEAEAADEVATVMDTQPIDTAVAAGLKEEAIQLDVIGFADSFAWQVVGPFLPDPETPPFLNGLPLHALLSFNDTAVDAPYFNPAEQQLRIIPMAAFQNLYTAERRADLNSRLATLERVLANRPDPAGLAGELPVLPDVGASPAFQSNIEYVDFEAGSGVRYLTVMRQDVSPMLQRELRYIFMGLTDDGRFLVTFAAPLTTAVLPESADLSGDEYNEFAETYDQYLSDLIAELEAADDFAPALKALDTMLGTLTIEN